VLGWSTKALQGLPRECIADPIPDMTVPDDTTGTSRGLACPPLANPISRQQCRNFDRCRTPCLASTRHNLNPRNNDFDFLVVVLVDQVYASTICQNLRCQTSSSRFGWKIDGKVADGHYTSVVACFKRVQPIANLISVEVFCFVMTCFSASYKTAEFGKHDWLCP
jgi:hypothetical protein